MGDATPSGDWEGIGGFGDSGSRVPRGFGPFKKAIEQCDGWDAAAAKGQADVSRGQQIAGIGLAILGVGAATKNGGLLIMGAICIGVGVLAVEEGNTEIIDAAQGRADSERGGSQAGQAIVDSKTSDGSGGGNTERVGIRVVDSVALVGPGLAATVVCIGRGHYSIAA